MCTLCCTKVPFRLCINAKDYIEGIENLKFKHTFWPASPSYGHNIMPVQFFIQLLSENLARDRIGG